MPNVLKESSYIELITSIKNRIRSAKQVAVRSVNIEMMLLYWYIGKSILEKQETQGWGTKVIDNLSADLTNEFPEMKGFSPRNLKYMRKFAKEYPDSEIVQAVLAQLSWYHNITLLDKINNKDIRLFYAKQAIENGWSRNIMVMQIENALHKRLGKAISNYKEKLPSSQSDLVHGTLKDPYIFDFLSLELGAGFAFIGRQYHLEVANQDFKPEYAGKMNFYLSAVDDLIKHENDQPTIGIILCKSKNNVLAEYTLRDMNKPIGLAEYRLTESLPQNLKTALPTIEELENELTKSLEDQGV